MVMIVTLSVNTATIAIMPLLPPWALQLPLPRTLNAQQFTVIISCLCITKFY